MPLPPAVQFLAETKGRGQCAAAGAVATGTFYDDTHQYWDGTENWWRLLWCHLIVVIVVIVVLPTIVVVASTTKKTFFFCLGAVGCCGVSDLFVCFFFSTDNTGGTGTGSTFYWSIPFGVAQAGGGGTESSVLRMRYNISTHDFPAYAAGDNYLSAADFDPTPGVDSKYNCKGDNNNAGVACSAVSPITQDPYIQVKGKSNTSNTLRFDTLRYASLRFDTLHYASIRFDTLQHASIRFA
jgi:hypothetical protein